MANEVSITVKGREAGAKTLLGELRKELVGAETRGKLAADQMQQIGQAAQKFLGQAASAASNLQQAVGGTEAVFGEASTAVDDFGKRSAESTGLSEAAFRDATTVIGGQLKRMTGDVGLAASASIELVQVGADLAATYGGTTKDAVDAFAAALRGEADPAERFNLNLKASVVNAKAVELGLAETTASVDEAAKAQAILALITEQSADAQGQFAREADTAAVAQQKAQAAWEDAQASLGQMLLPVIAEAAESVQLLARWFGALPDPAQKTLSIILLVSTAMFLLAPRILAAQSALVAFGMSARTANRSLGAFGVALGVLVTIMAGLSSKSDETKTSIEQLRATLDAETGAISTNTREWIANQLEREGVLAAGERFGASATDIIDAALGEEAALRRVNDALKEHAGVTGEGEVAIQGQNGEILISTEMLREWAGRVQEARDGWQRQTEAVEGSTAATEDATAAVDAHIESLAALADELRAQIDPAFALIRARQTLKDAQKAVTEAEEEHTKDSPQYRAALRDEADAALEVLAAAGELGDEFTGDLSAAQRKMLQDAGLSEEAIEQLRDDLRRAKKDADRLDGTRVDINVHTHYTSSGSPPVAPLGTNRAVASGGIIGADGGGPRGGTVLVNELGPELARLPSGDIVTLPFGSTVIPAGQSRSIMAGAAAGAGGSVTVNLYVQGSIRSDRDLIQLIRDEILNGGFRGALPGVDE